MPTTLKHIQRTLQNSMLNQQASDVLTIIRHGQTKLGKQKLEVYLKGYQHRLLEVLANDYPKVKILLGDQAFKQAGLLYIEQYPSSDKSLRWFGQYFADFLNQTPPYKAHPILSQMADFEWALQFALDAADAQHYSLKLLHKLPADEWPNLTLSMHPSVQVRAYTTDAPSLWRHMEDGYGQRIPKQLNEPQSFLIWRYRYQSRFESLSPVQEMMIHLFKNGTCFSKIAEQLCDMIDESLVPATLVKNLQYWIEQQIFIR